MMVHDNTGALVGTSSWAEQFREALTVGAGKIEMVLQTQ